jgi:hypothetical protein
VKSLNFLRYQAVAQPNEHETENKTADNVAARKNEIAPAEKVKGFQAEGGISGEPTEETEEEKQSGLEGKPTLFGCESTEDPDGQAANHIDDKGSGGEFALQGISKKYRCDPIPQKGSHGTAKSNQQQLRHPLNTEYFPTRVQAPEG